VTDFHSPDSRPEAPRLANRVTLRFDEFGQRSLEAEAGRRGTSLDELLGYAVAHFDAKLRMSRGAPPPPRFKPSGWGTPREVPLKLPRGRRERLENEAGRHGVPFGRLLEHAALSYLADLDSA
jgi:hypothetical protein